MKILAIDSSGTVASVAVLEDENILGEYTINYKLTHSQTLMPMLDELKKMIDLNLNSIDAIAVAAGPGSFTGLRIGSSTAKGMGLALNKPLVSVPTLEGLAYRMVGSSKIICPIMDARRNQVYTGLYGFEKVEDSYKLLVHMDQTACDILEIIEKINELGREVIFLGDGVNVFGEIISERCEVNYEYAPITHRLQSAAAVALRAADMFAEGNTESAAMHRPEYLRKSQAEREREEKLAND